MKKLYISDLQPNEPVQDIFCIQSMELRQKKNLESFLSMELADKTGILKAVIWDEVEQLANSVAARDFVEVRGQVQEYNGNNQLKISALQKVSKDQVDMKDFVPHTAYDVEEMYSNLIATIDSFENSHLKQLMQLIFNRPGTISLFKQAPAAQKLHHARFGGLLEHVVSQLRMAEYVARNYSFIDRDLLLSGVLLHDLGKVKELTTEWPYQYSDDGRLLGHIVMASNWVGKFCNLIEGFPVKLKTLLQHMVLSHHGKLEFGSPKKPLFPEAMALHHLDNLDTKLEIMRTAVSEIKDGSIWSPYNRTLETPVLNTKAYLGVTSDADVPLSLSTESSDIEGQSVPSISNPPETTAVREVEPPSEDQSEHMELSGEES